MDIYSAILVVVPLIIPLGNLFGIHPVHLGIMLPGQSWNWATSRRPWPQPLSSRATGFNEPIARVYRDVFVFLNAGTCGPYCSSPTCPLLTTALL